MDIERALSDLQSQNYFIWDDFLSNSEVAAIVLDYQQLYDQSAFTHPYSADSEKVIARDRGFRSDETYWLDENSLTQTQALFWNRLEEMKEKMNERLFLGLWSLEGHYSRYPVDGHYHQHLDRFSHNDQRTISMVLYFNSEWVEGDGGELRIHFPNAHPATLDVSPMAGRLICFLSGEVPHEVMKTNKVRLSFAGWWKRRAH